MQKKFIICKDAVNNNSNIQFRKLNILMFQKYVICPFPGSLPMNLFLLMRFPMNEFSPVRSCKSFSYCLVQSSVLWRKAGVFPVRSSQTRSMYLPCSHLCEHKINSMGGIISSLSCVKSFTENARTVLAVWNLPQAMELSLCPVLIFICSYRVLVKFMDIN